MKVIPPPRITVETGCVAASLAVSMLLASLGTSIANIALPALARGLSGSLSEVRWVIVAYLAGLTVSTLAAGQLGDRYGLRRILVAGLMLFAAASLASGLASDLPSLVGARMVQGIGAAAMMTLPLALTREMAGEARLGRAMGLLGAVSAIGTALGPPLGGAIVAVSGWRGVFLVLVPVAAAASLLAIASLPADGPRTRGKSCCSVIKVNAPIMTNLVVNLMVATVMMTTLVVGPFHLASGLGLTEPQAGLVMAVGPLISIAAGVPAGKLVDARGARSTLRWGLTGLAAGAVLMALAAIAGHVAAYLCAVAVLTPGYQLFQAANNMSTLAGVAQERRGTVSGLLGLSRNLGLIAGASIMASLFAFSSGASHAAQVAPEAVRWGAAATFASAGGLMVVALVIVMAARPEPGR